MAKTVGIEATSHVNHNFKNDVEKSSEIISLMDSCRVCMARSANMSCIFDVNKKQNIIKDIQFCTGVTIKQEAGLPSGICELCLNNLSVAYKFKTSCLVADEAFRKLVVTPSIKAEEPELSEYEEYEEIIDCKDEDDVDFGDVKEEMLIERVVEENVRKRERRPVKVKDSPQPIRGRPRKTAATLKTPSRLKKFKFKRLTCEPCDIKFHTKEESDEHKRKMHKDSETWVCEICGKMFIHRASHYTHVKSHQPPKYGCDQCDYKTWHKYDLVKHIRIHTGLKMYQCEYCTASYYTSSNLTSHIRRVHMNEKPHDCSICRRTFFDSSKLQRHLDSHLEIKRFECDICHSCFTRRCYWKKHLLRQHDITTPPQRPGRQKTNLVIGECLGSSKLDAIGEYYAKETVKKL